MSADADESVPVENAALRPLPAEQWFGLRMTSVGDRRSTAELTIPEGDHGVGPLGWCGFLADIVTGRPLWGAVPPDAGCATVSMSLRGAKPVRSGSLTATGEIAFLDSATSLGTATVRDSDGDLVAWAIVRFFVTRTDAASPAPIPLASLPAEADPRERGSLRVEPVASTEGSASFAFRATPSLGNEQGTLHGGVLACLADRLLSGVGQSGEVSRRLVDLDIRYHRPVPLDGSELTLRAEAERVGRRSASAVGSILAGDRLVASVSGILETDPQEHAKES